MSGGVGGRHPRSWAGYLEGGEALGEAGQAQNTQNTLTFAFAGFLTAIANFLFLEEILGTSLYPAQILYFPMFFLML